MTETRTITLGRHDASQPVVHTTIETPRGSCRIQLDLARATQRYMYDMLRNFGHYEEDVERELIALKPGDVFFDVGAHCGYFSAIAATMVGPQNVWSFEPEPSNFYYLSRNCPDGHNINAVVSDGQFKEPFFINQDNDGGHACWNPGAHDWNERTRQSWPEVLHITHTTLDIHAAYEPALIKIDTEGAELRVLRGAETVLKQPQLKTVICELNHFGLNQMGHDEAMLRRYMGTFHFYAPEPEHDGCVHNLIFRR